MVLTFAPSGSSFFVWKGIYSFLRYTRDLVLTAMINGQKILYWYMTTIWK